MIGLAIPTAIPLLVFLSVSLAFGTLMARRGRNPLLERVRAATRRATPPREALALWGRSVAEHYPLISRSFGYAGTGRKLKAAGFPLNMSPDEFVAVKLAALGLSLLALATCVVTGRLVPVVLGAAVLLPDLWLNLRIKGRNKRINAEFVPAAGRIAAAARAGKPLAEAVGWASSKSGGVLAESLRWCLTNLEAGIPIEASLDQLASDTGLLNIRRMATAVMNAQKYGTGIADALIVTARDVRRRRMDEVAARVENRRTLAVLALMLMIFPAVIIVVTPMLLRMQQVGSLF